MTSVMSATQFIRLEDVEEQFTRYLRPEDIADLNGNILEGSDLAERIQHMTLEWIGGRQNCEVTTETLAFLDMEILSITIISLD